MPDFSRRVPNLFLGPFSRVSPTLRIGSLLISLIATPVYSVEKDSSDTVYGYSDRYGTLTPTQVYSHVKNIDTLITYYATKYKPETASSLPADLVPAAGITPQQVFLSLGELCDDIDILSENLKLQPAKRIETETEKAIPAEVFLQAGTCMDAFVKVLAKLEPDKSFGDFYQDRAYNTAKTPSDVYALVKLLNRKMDILTD